MIRKIITLGLLCAGIVSCKQNLFEDELFRTRRNPFEDVPFTDSTSEVNTIYLNWKKDDGCDLYRLMRCQDSSTPNLSYEKIYEGTDTSFTDTKLEEDGRYFYYLEKVRGNKIFSWKDNISHGFSSSQINDDFEDNDSREKAVELKTDDLFCNIPCVCFSDGEEITDKDWFFVTIPARRTAYISICQDGITGNNPTNLYLRQEKVNSQSIVNQNTGITIENTYDYEEKFYFVIFPNTNGLYSTSSCSCLITYRLELLQIKK